MVWELERVKWSQLQANSRPELIPSAIIALQTASSQDEAMRAYQSIDYNVVVNGVLFESAVPTVVCLLGALQKCTPIGRMYILDLLVEICREQLDPASEVLSAANRRLRELCLRELSRGAAVLFDQLEYGNSIERGDVVDLLGLCCEVDEAIKDRVKWHLHRLLSEPIENGVRALTADWLAGLD